MKAVSAISYLEMCFYGINQLIMLRSTVPVHYDTNVNSTILVKFMLLKCPVVAFYDNRQPDYHYLCQLEDMLSSSYFK